MQSSLCAEEHSTLKNERARRPVSPESREPGEEEKGGQAEGKAGRSRVGVTFDLHRAVP